MKVQMWPVDKPVPYARNARKITDAAVDKVAASIKEYGWQQPIVVDAEGVIIAGHTRLLAAKRLGIESVPVVVARDLTPQQVKAYRLADNRLAQETTWDRELLGLEVQELSALGAVPFTGFETVEIEDLMAAAVDGFVIPEDDDQDSGPPPVTSHIRQLQVMVPQAQWAEFRRELKELGALWGTTNTTDTILRAVHECSTQSVPV